MALHSDCESRGSCVRLARTSLRRRPCEMAPERLRFYFQAQESRRNSTQAPSLCDDRIDPAVALSRTVQCGLVERPTSPTLDENLARETEIKVFGPNLLRLFCG